MSERSRIVRGLVLVAALTTASHSASAAPAKRHKPKPHAVPAASAPDAAPAHDAAAPAKPDADAPAKPDDKPTPKSDDAAGPKSDDKTPAAADDPSPPKPSDKASAKASDQERIVLEEEPPPGHDDEALGRREAARLAAGRYEVAVLASIDIGSRRFTYSDPIGPLLAPYRLSAAPMTSFGLEAYPFASSNVPGLRDFGFRGHISRAFGLDSTTPTGVKIDTSWTRFGGDVRERFLIPGTHPAELGLFIGAEASYFGMTTKTPVAALLPAARTIAVRLGFDARLLLTGRFSMMLGGAYLAPTSHGEIYDRFRSPHLGGVDGDVGFALGLLPGLEARLTGRYTRYFARFKPHIGDSIVAGGALDEQLQFGLGVRYAH